MVPAKNDLRRMMRCRCDFDERLGNITKVVLTQNLFDPPVVESSLSWAERLSDLMVERAFWLGRNTRFVLSLLLLTMTGLCALRGYGALYGYTPVSGQPPHVDFYSQLSPLPYLQTVLGMKVSHGPEGAVYGQIAFGFVAAIWSLLLSRTRLRVSLACLASLFVLLLAIAPFQVGGSFMQLTSTVMYNRSGYALMFIILIEALSPPSRGSDLELAGGISTGAALAILFFTKSIFFFEGVFVLLAVLSLRRQLVSRWAGIAAAFCAIFFSVVAYLQFDLDALFGGLGTMLRPTYVSPAKILSVALEVVSIEGLAFFAFVLLAAVVFWRQNEAKMAVGFGVAGVALVITGAFLLISNEQDRGLPLNAVLEILIAGKLMQSLKVRPIQDRAIRLCLIAGALMLTTGAMTAELAAIPYAAFERMSLDDAGSRSHRGSTSMDEHHFLFATPPPSK